MLVRDVIDLGKQTFGCLTDGVSISKTKLEDPDFETSWGRQYWKVAKILKGKALTPGLT
jgi:hypothetical protein